MKLFILCAALFGMLYANEPSALDSTIRTTASLQQTANLVLEVGDRDDVARKTIAHAEALGGYFLDWDEWSVTLHVPANALPGYLLSLDSLGHKVEQSYSTDDLGAQLQNLQASIDSRRKLLDEYFTMVKSSTVAQMQTVERAIVDLIAQLERDEGRLRLLQSKVDEAQVQVSFRFQDRTLPTPTGESPFAWINRLNLVEHRESFR